MPLTYGYPLDLPSADTLTRMATQPYPAYPNGIGVSRATFELTLSAWTPAVVAAIYIVVAKTANARLRRRQAQHKAGLAPPPKDHIKGNKVLSWLVLFHNAFLALYSAWTCFHAFGALIPYFYRGLRQGGLDGVSNAFCTVPTHAADGLGRYIWLFYISKYYEIVDSIILVAKGKRVSNLQSYHHAGAIVAMWAGCRYSASAIWIFLLFNSAIHSLMYTYYTCSTLQLRFAGALKKSMTTAQITQLVLGCFIASMYLWVSYSPLAYTAGALPSVGDFDAVLAGNGWYRALVDAVSESGKLIDAASSSFIGGSAASSALPSVDPASAAFHGRSSSAYESAMSTSTAYVLRENLLHAAHSNSKGRVTCVASTGQAFAVAFNVAYLLPLIALFLRFYFGSYRKPGKTAAKRE